MNIKLTSIRTLQQAERATVVSLTGYLQTATGRSRFKATHTISEGRDTPNTEVKFDYPEVVDTAEFAAAVDAQLEIQYPSLLRKEMARIMGGTG